jgi:hypothetical protein
LPALRFQSGSAGCEVRGFFRVVEVVRLLSWSVRGGCEAGWTFGAACAVVSSTGFVDWVNAAAKRMTAASRSLPGGKVMSGIF